jgi:hypothetical protein
VVVVAVDVEEVKVVVVADLPQTLAELISTGARRRRNGGGPGEGCARRPVGTYLYLHAVGAGNPIAVPGMAR